MSDNAQFELLAATRNAGKVRELEQLLGVHGIRLSSLDELPHLVEIEETGSTFRENAVLKAQGYALQAEKWAIADDSGLEVAVLNSRPGVHSARYAGKNAGYDTKIPSLLREIESAGNQDRSARFVCVMALADERGATRFIAEGICEGRIADAPRGGNGFGYDPVFIPDGFDLTFGELSDDIKARISHRARAASKIIRYLLDFTGVSLDQ